MNVIVEKLPQCRASMRVELSKAEVESERKEVVEAFRSQARIPGYRPGKTPLPVIEKRFQKEITEELQTRLVRRGCREGIEKESLEVIAITKIDDPSIHTDQTFSFTAQLQITPEVQLPSYDGIEVKLKPVVVTEEDVDRQMDALRHRQSEFHDLTDRSLQMGDFAVVNYSATLDGQPLSEAVEGTGFLAKGESEWLRLDPESFIPGFCENLTGLSTGDTKAFDVAVGEDFQIEALRGKTLHYEISVVSAKQQILPEWTDDLAKAFGEDLTVESLRENCRTRIEKLKQEQRTEEMTAQILEFLDQHADFELPDRVLAHETQRQVNQIVTQIHQRGMSEDEITGHKDAIIQHASTQAEVNVKTAFILRQIAEKEKIQTSERELVTYCMHLAEAAGISVKKYVRQLQKSDALDEVTDRIIRSKTLDFLRKKAKVTEVTEEEAAAQTGTGSEPESAASSAGPESPAQ